MNVAFKFRFMHLTKLIRKKKFQIRQVVLANSCIQQGLKFLREVQRPAPHNRELKQTRRLRKRERHLKMCPCVSAIIFQLFKLIMLEKCVLTILELNWNQRLGHKMTKLNICYHMLTSSTQLQNWGRFLKGAIALFQG